MFKPDQKPPITALIRIECSSHDSVTGAVDETTIQTIASTRWLSLSTISYRFEHDPKDTYPRKWEIASRTTKQPNAIADAVVILAILRLTDGPRILLVRQFRPPMRAVSVELPAGLIDPGETIEQAALRELREETGFVGIVRRVHKPASLSPGMASELVSLVEVEIEGKARGQNLDPSENIQVVSVPLSRLGEALEHMAENGTVVKHAVSSLAVGLRLGTSLLSDPAK